MSAKEKEKIKISLPKVFVFLLILVAFYPMILRYSFLFQQMPYIKKITHNDHDWINFLTFVVIPFSTLLIVAILETLMNIDQLIASVILNTEPLKKITDYTYTKDYFFALIYSYKKVITLWIIAMILTALYGMANALKEQIDDIKRKEERDREMYEREILGKYY